MSLIYEERDSVSPYIETVTRGWTMDSGVAIRPAEIHWHMVFAKHHSRLHPMVVGSTTAAGDASWTADAEVLWIKFRLGTFMPSPEGFEGPWATFARMETLRSPPELAGPELGFANLTFRAWFEAQFGRLAWTKMHRIPRLQWLDYLRWYRKVTDLPIENHTELVNLSGDSETVLLTVRSAAGIERVAARRLLLANGRDGLGGAYVPPLFAGLD